MPTPIYPSLSSHAGALTDPSEVIPSLLRHMFATPATSSDYFEGQGVNYKISFRRLEAEYGTKPEVFCDEYQRMLSTAINRYFPTRRFSVVARYKYINELNQQLEEPNEQNQNYPRYNVTLDVQEMSVTGELTPVIISGSISINPNTHEFTINFKGIPKG